jgi:hypothetical protein
MRRFEPPASVWLGESWCSSPVLWGAAPNPAFATGQPPGMIKPSPATARSVGSLHAVKRLSRHKRAARRPFIPRSAGQRFAPSGQGPRRQSKPIPVQLIPALRSNERTSPLLRNAISGDKYGQDRRSKTSFLPCPSPSCRRGRQRRTPPQSVGQYAHRFGHRTIGSPLLRNETRVGGGAACRILRRYQ